MAANIYDSLEVVYLYRPLGVTLGERKLRGLKLECRMGDESELSQPALINASRLKLFVLKPQTYALHAATLQKNSQKLTNEGKIAFLLIEDLAELATVRLRKKIQGQMNHTSIVGDLRAPYTFNQVLNEINKATHHLFLNANEDQFSGMVAIREIESRALNEVGKAMTNQSSTDELMRLVLDKAVELSTADSGFLFMRENLFGQPTVTGESSVKLLRSSSHKFVQKARICKSQNIRINPVLLDPQRSSFTSQVVNRSVGISWSKNQESPTVRGQDISSAVPSGLKPELEFDEKSYALGSYCCFPLRTPSEEVVGFLLLLNRRVNSTAFLDDLPDIEKSVAEFDAHDLNILEALANQAGVSIDHTRLIQDLKTVFESFVEASVVAIESRDPTTKGHSERVAILTCGLAEAVSRTDMGSYANVSFNASQLYELRYAALLHDFGKIGVREDVLSKEKKLYPQELGVIQQRFSLVQKELQIKCLENYLEGLMRKGEAPTQEGVARIMKEVRKIQTELDDFWGAIAEANEPHVVNSGNYQKISDIAAVRVKIGNDDLELITQPELLRLSIRRGSLSPEERLEIESHVTHSYRFLINIPWTSELANLPDIVYAHHERMDGSGYPRKLVSDEIPIQAKIMAIADIFDALVAMDRPYKKAMPTERALSILESEVKEGKLDKELFRIFVQARIAELIKAAETRFAS